MVPIILVQIGHGCAGIKMTGSAQQGSRNNVIEMKLILFFFFFFLIVIVLELFLKDSG